VTVTLLAERYGEFDQVGIRVTARFDIGLLNPEGVVVLDGVTP
jgi:HK97 family phage major capsid protein